MTGESFSWLAIGAQEFTRSWRTILLAMTPADEADCDDFVKGLWLLTETQRLLFQNACARLIVQRDSYRMRKRKVEKLWRLLKEPIAQLGTEREPLQEGGRLETDYTIAMLHALMLAMPERK